MSPGEIARAEISRLRNAGMTLSQIAALANCNASTLASVANGEIENPSELLVNALKALPTPDVVGQRSLPDGFGGVQFNQKNIEGMAAVYYDGTPQTQYQLTPKIIERIQPGAFDGVLRSKSDILGLYNHDGTQLLGRRSSGTLKLNNTSQGLHYSIPYDQTDPIHQTVAARIARRDVSGSSFSFSVDKQTFEKQADGMIVRNILSYKRVGDVGPTHIPAYPGTSAEFRNMREIAQIELEASLAFGVEPPTPIDFHKYLCQA